MNQFDVQTQKEEALILVGLYHTSKALTETAEYLINGYNYKKRIDNVVRQHIDIALDLIPSDVRLRDFISIINKDLQSLIRHSIWNGTAFQDQIKNFASSKVLIIYWNFYHRKDRLCSKIYLMSMQMLQ